ncbi:hypothetical protein QBC38DRAFT_201436 [Podospora fimiseda]|uniref:Uncharacterized protein n=1 Tax=Podospora fimiseda TaxID=252190 RepID=A0AAN7BXX5_9PEZI|nr:hypothetical protein QBC38DRAFT_201436 [Podospora fimiseda]
MILILFILALFLHRASSQYNPNPANTNPWSLAATIVTETVWTICTVEETQTVSHDASPPIFETTKFTACPQVIEQLASPAIVTNIVLPDAEQPVLTSVTVQPPTSSTSCYDLPTPTSSLEVIAFSANDISRDANTDTSEPVFFYVGNNATSPEYVGTFIDGNQLLLDLSPDASAAGRVAILLAGGESLVFDQTGVHHYDAGCTAGSSLVIPSFMDQVLSIASAPNIHFNEPGPVSGGYGSGHALGKREMQSKNFTVQIVVESIIDAELQGPNMTWGLSPCTFISRTPGQGEWPVFTWTCDYPGKQSREKKCEMAFYNWLRPRSPNSVSGRGLIQSGDDLFQYLPRF